MQALHVLQGAVGGRREVSVPGGQEVEDAGVEVDVLHLQLLPAALPGALQAENLSAGGRLRLHQGRVAWSVQLLKLQAERGRREGQRQVARLVDALSAGAAVEAELQVLGGVVGLGQLLRDAHGQRQVAAQLPNDHPHADVSGVELHVVARAALGDPQSPHLPRRAVWPRGDVYGVTAAHRPVVEGRGEVIRDRLVDPLVRTALVGLEDDGDLWTPSKTHRCQGVLELIFIQQNIIYRENFTYKISRE